MRYAEIQTDFTIYNVIINTLASKFVAWIQNGALYSSSF